MNPARPQNLSAALERIGLELEIDRAIWSAYAARRGWTPVHQSSRRTRCRARCWTGMREACRELDVSHHTLLAVLRGKLPTVRLIEAITGVARAEWRRMSVEERLDVAKKAEGGWQRTEGR